MVVTNNTVLDKDEAFQYLTKISKSSFIQRYILIGVIFLCGLPVEIYGIVKNNLLYIISGLVFLAFSLGYTVWTFISVSRLPKKIYKQNQAICENGIKYSYTFKEQSVSMVMTIGSKNTKEAYKYDTIKNVYEFKDYYQVNFKEEKILLVYKNGFENPKMEEFFRKNFELNKKKIKLKYKNK